MFNFVIVMFLLILLAIYNVCSCCYRILKSQIKQIDAIATNISAPQITNSHPVASTATSNEGNKNPLLFPERFSVNTLFAYSSAEQKMYTLLSGILSTHYTVIPHISLHDIFSYNNIIDDDCNIYKFLGYHVDFVIFDKLYHPVMAIELNGSTHKNDKQIVWTDDRKKEFFQHFQIPLIVLDLSISYSDTALSNLLLNKILKMPQVVYCWSCHTPITYEFNSAIRSVSCSHCQRENIPLIPLVEKSETVLKEMAV